MGSLSFCLLTKLLIIYLAFPLVMQTMEGPSQQQETLSRERDFYDAEWFESNKIWNTCHIWASNVNFDACMLSSMKGSHKAYIVQIEIEKKKVEA